MNKLRISYSLMDAWLKKDLVKVGNTYLHIKGENTEAQNIGIKFDKYVEDYVMQNYTLPPELGSMPLDKPIPKFSGAVSYNEQFDISFEMDILAKNGIIEIKASEGSDSADFSNTLQIPFYFLVLSLMTEPNKKSGLWNEQQWELRNIDRAYIYRYNPAYKKYDRTMIYKTPRHIKEVRFVIDTEGPELYKFLESEGLL